MALSSCLHSSQIYGSHKIDLLRFPLGTANNIIISQRCLQSLQSKKSVLFGGEVFGNKVSQCTSWGFLGVPRSVRQRNLGTTILLAKRFAVFASWFASSQIASTAFTLGTAAVLPFYTSMVVAPRSEFTKKLLGSSIPYLALGTLYVYLLYLSWSPETICLMFATKYWLPELQSIAKMFSSEMTLASAWIHLLAVDLFAARQIYFDGLRNNVEIRHSVSLCLLFCPIGILVHFLTKPLSRSRRETAAGIQPLEKWPRGDSSSNSL